MKKILITTAVAAALLTTSMGVYAASNSVKNTNAAPKSVSTTATVSDLAKDISNSQGRIEYTKTATLRADGSEGVIFESWVDPKTHDSRTDNIIKNSPSGANCYTSSYSIDGGRRIVTIQRDASDKALSGNYEDVNQAGADYNNSLYSKYNSFEAIKAQYASSDWKSEGTVKTQDGKTVEKLSKGLTLANKVSSKAGNSITKVNGQEIAYIDKTTELPVKTELYKEVNGSMTLEDTQTYEFKYIDNAGNLFDTSGVNLKELPPFNYDGNSVG